MLVNGEEQGPPFPYNIAERRASFYEHKNTASDLNQTSVHIALHSYFYCLYIGVLGMIIQQLLFLCYTEKSTAGNMVVWQH